MRLLAGSAPIGLSTGGTTPRIVPGNNKPPALAGGYGKNSLAGF